MESMDATRRPPPDDAMVLDTFELSTGDLYLYDASRADDCWLQSDLHITLEKTR